MSTIIIDGREVACREGISVLQAALDAGFNIPHYCYHPGLSIAASCRLCLMEIKMPHPKTGELAWSPKLTPSCQMPVKDGMEVRFDSDMVRNNQRHVMEYLLLNHPLDCPVCDQSGECLLQDYALQFGHATSRMVDPKHNNRKKDIGPHTLSYQDRCIMCTRCVRFCREVAGTGELCVVNRGHKNEIDVFPGVPLVNKLQGNVVDVCPVGSMLDKNFLMTQRVWFLSSVESVCPMCSRGCTIRIDHNQGKVWRIKPRFNPHVNDWWMCDDGRFCWRQIYDDRRLTQATVKRGGSSAPVDWKDVPGIVRSHFERAGQVDGGKQVGVAMSPFMACEEAWLLGSFIRDVAPNAMFTVMPTPTEGEDEVFPVGATREQAKFIINAEKAPNRKGVEKIVLATSGRHAPSFDDFIAEIGSGRITTAWVAAGSPEPWTDSQLIKAAEHLEVLVVQDYLHGLLSETAHVVLPMCAWAEREGSFINDQGLVQRFQRAVLPPDGLVQDGQYLFELAGHRGVYNAGRVREMMAEAGISEFGAICEAPAAPAHAH